jgi:hypothetical protein
MRSHRVLVPPPFFDDDLHLFEAVEDPPVEQFIPETSVKALAISVFKKFLYGQIMDF